MNEEAVIQQLKDSGVDLVVSLPCDKNKLLTDMLLTEQFIPVICPTQQR